MYVYIYMYIYIYTYITHDFNIYVLSTHADLLAYMDIHKYTHASIHTCMHIHIIHACIQTEKHIGRSIDRHIDT